MAIAAEMAFRNAVAAAEAARQQTKAAAFITYGYVVANLAAYIVALADADVAYTTAVNAAADTSNLLLGVQGQGGPIPTQWASLTS